jgi:ribonuclease P/MRP protein subunit POP5
MVDKKPKFLSPTLRYKKRYVAYKAISEKNVDFQDLYNAIWKSLVEYLGEKGVSETRIWVIKNTYDTEKKMGLIRCAHTGTDNVRAGLSFVQKVGDIPVVVQVVGVSGTIKAAKQKFFGERSLESYT